MQAVGSTLFQPTDPKSIAPVATNYFRLTTNISSLIMKLSDPDGIKSPMLTCSITDAIVSMTSSDSNTSTNSIVVTNNTKYSLTFKYFDLFQTMTSSLNENENSNSTHKQILVSFLPPKKPSAILRSPHIDIKCDLKSVGHQSSSCSIFVSLEPLVVSVHLLSLTRWIDVVLSLLNGVATGGSLSTSVDFKVSIPQIDLLFHSDKSTPAIKWKNVIQSINFNNDPWINMNRGSESILRTEHLADSLGGFHFKFCGIQLNVSGVDLSDFIIEIDKLEVTMFLKHQLDDKDRLFSEALVFQAIGDNDSVGKGKVKISKKSLQEFDIVGASLEESSLGPSPPSVSTQNTIYVHAHQILVG